MNKIREFFKKLWARIKARFEPTGEEVATPVAYVHYEAPVAPSNPVKTTISEPIVEEKRTAPPSDGLLKPGTPVILRGFEPGISKTFKFERKTAGRVVVKAFETVGTDVTADVTIALSGGNTVKGKARGTSLDQTVEAGVHEFSVSSSGAKVLAVDYLEPKPTAPRKPRG